MRKNCERRGKARGLMLAAFAAGILALVFYCVPWWVFLIVGVVSLLGAGWMLLRE
ncbi:MAG: hypothetical protein IJL62_01505 [Clostridia bacterium]|nr:hypothetical protein [Clostridia bacterium]